MRRKERSCWLLTSHKLKVGALSQLRNMALVLCIGLVFIGDL